MKHTRLATAISGISVLGLTLTACGSGEPESAGAFPSEPIQVIVGFAAGGGTDLGARQLMPLVEKELGDGAEIQVVNEPGAGGWVAWEHVLSEDPDGYTLTYMNTPNLQSGYINPELGREKSIDDFTFLANQVTDPGAISIRNDEDRFTDLKSLIEYAKTHELTTTSTGVGSDDHISALQLNKELGTKFKIVHTEGASEGMSSFLGGHVDVLFNNVGEAFQPNDQGELKTVGVLAEERSEFLPDVPTVEESGFGPVHGSSSRGVGAPAGMPDDIKTKLSDAFRAAIESEEHKKVMDEQGLAINYQGPDDYKNLMLEEDKKIEGLKDLLGWS
ncbi:tripartite tricarboxylate transporter substrate binding protein [Brevibacterium sp.]|uniref:Bug family tripartite tricarboxylate transporter substrate binding protein n=1 Tax=Brevibacterium sp. TaxID=1701 RepID=UPI002811FE9F|nr:tripartite tricarboxylate transporter substrate binding protein [Brevibacterium sp.]